MDRSVARLNIEHFRRLLAEQTDEPPASAPPAGGRRNQDRRSQAEGRKTRRALAHDPKSGNRFSEEIMRK
jgi:hypothetical protein